MSRITYDFPVILENTMQLQWGRGNTAPDNFAVCRGLRHSYPRFNEAGAIMPRIIVGDLLYMADADVLQ